MYSIALLSTTEYATKSEIWESYIAKIAEHDDKSAFEALYKDTKTAVYGFALSLVKNPQDAEDVLHDTFLQLYGAAKKYEPRGKPMAYLLTIVRNLCLMKFRQSQKIADVSEEEWEKFLGANDQVTADDRMVLLHYLKGLSQQEQEIVILFAVAGFKHREIGQMLGLPLPTVLSKYGRAIRKLKKCFTGGERP